MTAKALNFRKVFGFSLVAILVLYLLISLYLLFVPGAVFLNRKITGYHNWFALPGPYFRDDRLRAVPHLTISYKKNSEWSEQRNIAYDNFIFYHQHVSYHSLARSRYEQYLSVALNRAAKDVNALPGKRAFKEFHQYLKDHYLPGEVDSINVVYQLQPLESSGHPGTTLFQLKYKSY